ncbi:MAG: flagellar basal body-associated FliL family protein [Pseudomonadota bacterium]
MSEKADAEKDAATPQKGGLNMMGLLVLGVACATTSFASVYFFAPAPTVAEAATEPPGQMIKAEASEVLKQDLTYTPVQEILITIGHAPATRYLKMQVSLATERGDVRKVRSAETALIDAFLQYLRSIEVEDFEDPGFYKHMREQLGRRADLILGNGVSHGVYITEFLVR